MALPMVFLILVAQMQSSMGDVYIVYMGKKTFQDHELITNSHHEMLASVLGSKDLAKDAILYSYQHGFNGFAADIDPAHAEVLSKMPGVVSVFRNKKLKLQTTRSWDFLGLDANAPTGVLQEADYGVDVIVGVVDTGVWPESQSFNDKSMPPVPKRWKGICQTGESFTASNCNRKLIGARYFDKGFQEENGTKTEYRSPRDKDSHGTHTSSTAVGRLVAGASVDGLGIGVARGGAPLARLAVYKFFQESDSLEADVLSAIDYAIHDGVDIISISAGQLDRNDYTTDVLAIGAFHAVERGVLVVASAGNEGPSFSTVLNTPPWMFTVAASTIDRGFYAKIVLPDNITSCQASPSTNRFKAGVHGIASALEGFCIEAGLNATIVRGKYVLCTADVVRVDVEAIKKAGGLGIILPDTLRSLIKGKLDLPAFVVSGAFAVQLSSYILQEKSPTIFIHPSETVTGIGPAPAVATFSSRGPNKIAPDILKPDVTAPGVGIIAAVPPKGDSTSSNSTNSFGIKSGTSMSCPHVAGVAALVKSVHPNWSPSAIKSAIMTTASNMDNTRDMISDTYTNGYFNPFGYGAGHINPIKAADPGLVYDATPQDYALFCCSLGNICKIGNFKCPSQTPAVTDLNYPSITISNLVASKTVKRVVTNVGAPNSIYRVTVEEPHGVKVKVEPNYLWFSKWVTKLSYVVTFETAGKPVPAVGHYVFGSITWSDGVHCVRSPITIQLNDFTRT